MYKINSDIDIPIYTQLVDSIRSDIFNGVLPYGAKLPTVRELSESCGIAPGTVMRVYGQLEQMGIAEKKQGKGTFVCFRPVNEISRKDRAMAAIDAMLDTMDELNFSESERNIFLNLKLRQRAIGSSGVQIAVIECNNEVLYQISEQLRGIGDVTVYPYQLDDIRAYPYQLPEDMDLLVVPASHAEELTELLPNRGKIVKVVLSLTPRTLKQLARIPAGSRIQILSQSVRFGELLANACREYTDSSSVRAPKIFSKADSKKTDAAARPDVLSPSDVLPPPELYSPSELHSPSDVLPPPDVLLVPENYERYCEAETAEHIRSYAQAHTLIPCEYRIDDGSMMYLSDRIRNAKNR